MQRRIVSLIACLALATLAVVPARANGTTQGRILSVGLHGFTDQLYVGEVLTGAITVALEDDGSLRRKPITVTTWIGTPFGRATLSQQLYRLAPGQQATYIAAIPYTTPIPGSQASMPVTIGVTVSVKGETIEASHSLTIYSTPTTN